MCKVKPDLGKNWKKKMCADPCCCMDLLPIASPWVRIYSPNFYIDLDPCRKPVLYTSLLLLLFFFFSVVSSVLCLTSKMNLVHLIMEGLTAINLPLTVLAEQLFSCYQTFFCILYIFFSSVLNSHKKFVPCYAI